MRKRMLQLKALPVVGISVLPGLILRSSASAGDPTRVASSSSRAGAAPSSFRSRWPSRSPTPAPPSAPVLGRVLPRPGGATEQALNSFPNLFADHVADESDEVRRAGHRRSHFSGGQPISQSLAGSPAPAR